MAAIREIRQEIKDLKKLLESAFSKNEDGEYNYTEHKFFHRRQTDSESEYSRAKEKVLKDILSWAAVGLLTIIGTALVQSYGIPIPFIGK